MQRFKNYGIWVAGVALVLDILIYSGYMSVSEKDQIEILVQRGLEVLVLAGIINNPTERYKF